MKSNIREKSIRSESNSGCRREWLLLCSTQLTYDTAINGSFLQKQKGLVVVPKTHSLLLLVRRFKNPAQTSPAHLQGQTVLAIVCPSFGEPEQVHGGINVAPLQPKLLPRSVRRQHVSKALSNWSHTNFQWVHVCTGCKSLTGDPSTRECRQPWASLSSWLTSQPCAPRKHQELERQRQQLCHKAEGAPQEFDLLCLSSKLRNATRSNLPLLRKGASLTHSRYSTSWPSLEARV